MLKRNCHKLQILKKLTNTTDITQSGQITIFVGTHCLTHLYNALKKIFFNISSAHSFTHQLLAPYISNLVSLPRHTSLVQAPQAIIMLWYNLGPATSCHKAKWIGPMGGRIPAAIPYLGWLHSSANHSVRISISHRSQIEWIHHSLIWGILSQIQMHTRPQMHIRAEKKRSHNWLQINCGILPNYQYHLTMWTYYWGPTGPWSISCLSFMVDLPLGTSQTS